MYCAGLTRNELEQLGVISIYNTPDGWKMARLWYRNNSGHKELKEISVSEAKRKHKYRPDKVYPKFQFSANGIHYSIVLSRAIYVWYKGDIPDGYVIDHIDNNPYNNDPENLKLMTIEDNLNKRFEDNPESWTNQYGKLKNWNK